jgi:hypothetical protein
MLVAESDDDPVAAADDHGVPAHRSGTPIARSSSSTRVRTLIFLPVLLVGGVEQLQFPNWKCGMWCQRPSESE